MAEITVKTLDQRRAKHAWELVKKVKASGNDKAAKEFGTQAKKLPTRIMAAGLGQALAFLKAKKLAPELQKELFTWMTQRRPSNKGTDLVEWIMEADADFLRFATAECLAYLQWVVRFADAEGLTRGED